MMPCRLGAVENPRIGNSFLTLVKTVIRNKFFSHISLSSDNKVNHSY